MDLTEAEDIKKTWQEYTEELYKKDLHDPCNHSGVTSHLEAGILECQVKRGQLSSALGEVQSSGPEDIFSCCSEDCTGRCKAQA